MTLKELEIIATKLKKYLKKDDMPCGEIPSIGVYLNCLDKNAIKNICSEDFEFEAKFDYIKIFNNKKLLQNMDCVPALKLLLNDMDKLFGKYDILLLSKKLNSSNSVVSLEKLYELYCNENILKANKLMIVMNLLYSKISKFLYDCSNDMSTEAFNDELGIIKLMLEVAQECYPGNASYLKALELMNETSRFTKARLIKTIETGGGKYNRDIFYGIIGGVKDSSAYEYLESLILDEKFIKLDSTTKRILFTTLVNASEQSEKMISLIYETIIKAINKENYNEVYGYNNKLYNDLNIILEAKDIETAKCLAELVLNEEDVMSDEHDDHMDTILNLKDSKSSPYNKRTFIDVMTGKNNDELDNILYNAVIYSDGDKEKELDESIFQIKK